MYDEANGAESVRNAITHSCVLLLCGSGKEVRRAARLLHNLYGIPSYALLISGGLLPLPFYLKRIPTPCRSPQLLAEIAIRFFASLDPSTLPVLLDCTEDRIFLGDPTLRSELESRCFLSDLSNHSAIPPFCYLMPFEGASCTGRSDRPC